jgi:hypothetical protein
MLARRGLRLWILTLWIVWIVGVRRVAVAEERQESWLDLLDETDLGLILSPGINNPGCEVLGRDESPPDEPGSFTAGRHDRFPVYPKWLPITRVNRRARNLHTLSNHIVTGGDECAPSSSPNQVTQKSCSG